MIDDQIADALDNLARLVCSAPQASVNVHFRRTPRGISWVLEVGAVQVTQRHDDIKLPLLRASLARCARLFYVDAEDARNRSRCELCGEPLDRAPPEIALCDHCHEREFGGHG